MELVKNVLTVYGIKIIGAIVVFFIGAWVATLVKTALARLLNRRSIDSIIGAFLVNLAHIGLMVFVVIAALSIAGVPTTSFVAVIGAAGLAIGLALQGSLSNFAAGFLLVVFRPFRRGDYIDGAGASGIVDEIQIFTTILKTPDNRRVIIPNGKLTSDNIINYSALDTRRVDLTVGVSYSDDIKHVKSVLQRIAHEDKRVLKEPAPEILVSELADNSVNFIMRVWVKSGDYWPFKFDTTEKVKLAFDAEGITIPFPQRDVHLFQENKT